MKVLYLLGCNEGPSKRYRVFNHIEALNAQGVEANWVWDIDPEITDEVYLATFSIIVVFRSGYNDRVKELFNTVRKLNIPIVYDIDDLVFDPSVVDQVDAYRKMSTADKKGYLEGIESLSAAMMACQYVTTSTSFLANYIRKFSQKPVYQIPFGVNERQVEIAKASDPWEGGPRFIGYLSGTKTHQRDFEEAAEAMRRILTEYDDVYLKLIGYLDVEKHLPGLSHKIVHLDFMSWEDLLIESMSLYINIAPFEQDSLFCQAKSNLKFVETALCGVPTIASPIPSFVDAIEDGVNGFIAGTTDEWYSAFQALLDDSALRTRVGEEAYLTCARNYFPKRIGQSLIRTYEQITKIHHGEIKGPADELAAGRSLAAKKNGLRITWVIPQPFEGSGGHRNIFRAIRYLAEFGHNCSIYVLPDNHRFANGAEIDAFIAREFFDVKADQVVLGTDDIEKCDVLICTYWTTAYVIKEQQHKSRLQVYFLQDFEPMFFPMGTDYVRAMETYSFGFYPITSGPWPLRMLNEEFGITEGSFFRFPIDRGIYFPRSSGEKKGAKRVVFFARPDMPRRCYPLGVAALALVNAARPDVEIVFYGDKSEKFTGVPFEFTNVGMTDTIAELGDLYRSGDVGLCFSTTNPSLVPFEMMACGCPVVDLDVNGNVINYGSSDNCVLVRPNPEAIANGILKILDDEALATRLTANGIEFAKAFPSEIEMVRTIEGFILDAFEAAKRPAAKTIAGNGQSTKSEGEKGGSKAEGAKSV
jgi:glycosyltransferase involved in cell wall biosynthesis